MTDDGQGRDGGASRRSLFDTTYARLAAAIAGEAWRGGEKLPSEVDLAASLGVSRPLLREVLRELERSGRIIRRHGAGTFVARPRPIEAKLPTIVSLEFAAASVSARIEEIGRTVELLTVDNGDAAVALGLQPGETMWRITRIKTVAGRPVVALVDHVPGWLVPSGRIEDELGASVFDLVMAYARTPTVTVIDRLSAELADREASERLAVSVGTVLMTIDKTVSREDGTILQAGRAQHVAERFRFTVESKISTANGTAHDGPDEG